MDKLKAQADQLRKLLMAPSTGATYQQALVLTGAILKETGLFLWLIVCLIVILVEWFWNYSYQAGQNTRNWVADLQTKSTLEAKDGSFWSEIGKSLLNVGQNTTYSVLTTARTQLGMEAPPPRSTPTPSNTPLLHDIPVTPQTTTKPMSFDVDGLMNEPKVPAVEPPDPDGLPNEPEDPVVKVPTKIPTEEIPE